MSNFLSSLLSIFRGSSNLPQQLQDMGISTTTDASSIQLQTRAGQQIGLNATHVIIQDTNGNTITLDATGIHIQSSAAVKLDCSTIEMNVGQIQLNTGMLTVTGVVKCETLITNAVISNTYTPGAGNIW